MSDENTNKKFTCSQVLAPLPQTERGFAFKLEAYKGRIAHGNSSNVVVRSIADPTSCMLFHGHKAKVNVARFSPNGEWIASGDATGKVIIWGIKNKNIKLEVQVCQNIKDIAWSDDGQRIAAVGEGASIRGRVFTWDSGNNVGDPIEISKHGKTILSVAYRQKRPFRVVTSSEDFGVHYLEGPPFKCTLRHTSEHTNYVNEVRFTPDGAHFVSVGSDRKICVFESEKGAKVREIESKESGHTGSIMGIAFSPDGSQFATASADKSVKIWNFASGEVVKTYKFPDVISNQQLAVVWDGQTIVSASVGGNLYYFDCTKGDEPYRTLYGHRDAISDMKVAKNGAIFSCSADGSLCHWDQKEHLPSNFRGNAHNGKALVSVGVSSDDTHLWSVGLDDKAVFSELKDDQYGSSSVALGGCPVSLAPAAKDAQLCAVGVTGKVLLVRPGKVVASVGITYRPVSIAFSPDDSEVAVGGDDRRIHIFKVKSDTLTKGPEFGNDDHQKEIVALKYAPNNKWLVSADADRYVHVWTCGAYSKPINAYAWRYHDGKVTDIAISPSSKYIATCSIDQTICVFTDLEKFSETHETITFAHIGGVQRINFFNDETIVSSGADKSSKIWTFKL